MNKVSSDKIIIGRAEYVDFLDYNSKVPCKIDSGAYGSAMHADNIKEIEDKGIKYLGFTLFNHPLTDEIEPVECRVKKYDQITVTSTSGHTEKRFRFKAKISLAGKTFETVFSLTDRSHAVFPVLIGRRAISQGYLINVRKSSVKHEFLKEKHPNSKNWDDFRSQKEEIL
jgi:hypothetical protein